MIRRPAPGGLLLLLALALAAPPASAQDTPAEDPAPPAPESESAGEIQRPLDRLVLLHGELRFELLGGDLQALGSNGGQLGFGLSRGRVGVELRPAPNVRSLVILDVRQNDATAEVAVGSTGESVRVDAYPGDWEPHVPFAYVQFHGETGPVVHAVTAGVQRTTFGIRDAYDLDPGFYVPHPSAFKDLARRAGVIPAFDLGLLYSADLKGLAALDLMVMNGTGWRSVEDDLGKHLIGRVRITPVEPIEVRATVMYGLEGEALDTSTLAWQASGEVRFGPARVVVEGLGGKTYAPTNRIGFLGVAGAASVELTPPLEAIDHVTPVVSLQRFDPTTGLAVGDAWTLIAAGASLYWATWNDVPLWTGLAWEMAITEDPSSPISHSAVVQVGWRI